MRDGNHPNAYRIVDPVGSAAGRSATPPSPAGAAGFGPARRAGEAKRQPVVDAHRSSGIGPVGVEIGCSE